ncbi:MAG TPA: FKBP-type peptidyl-prolyl cis-trans isomerase [Moraxellaceae bacterium]
MKTPFLATATVLALSLGLVACNKPKLDNDDSKAAYSIGYMTGKQSEIQAPKLDTAAFVAGFKDAYAKKASALNEEEMKKALMAYQQKIHAEALAAQNKGASEAASKGNAYLAENAKKPGVKTTASGLQYEVITEGKGASPKPSDVVRVHYEGKLTDGSVFDSSLQRGEPAEFPLDRVIPGWTEGLQLMKVGSKYKLTVPSALGYGEQGMGPIPPNSVLVFEVELLEIKK